jgi:hypothetical protein
VDDIDMISKWLVEVENPFMEKALKWLDEDEQEQVAGEDVLEQLEEESQAPTLMPLPT